MLRGLLQVLEHVGNRVETAVVHQAGHDAHVEAEHALHVPIRLQDLAGIGDAEPLARGDTLAFAPDRAAVSELLPSVVTRAWVQHAVLPTAVFANEWPLPLEQPAMHGFSTVKSWEYSLSMHQDSELV